MSKFLAYFIPASATPLTQARAKVLAATCLALSGAILALLLYWIVFSWLEEIETVINRHAAIRLSRVRSRKSPIIGAIVVADIMLNDEAAGSDQIALKSDIMALCKRELPPHKIPAVLNVVAAIETTIGGKIAR